MPEACISESWHPHSGAFGNRTSGNPNLWRSVRSEKRNIRILEGLVFPGFRTSGCSEVRSSENPKGRKLESSGLRKSVRSEFRIPGYPRIRKSSKSAVSNVRIFVIFAITKYSVNSSPSWGSELPLALRGMPPNLNFRRAEFGKKSGLRI